MQPSLEGGWGVYTYEYVGFREKGLRSLSPFKLCDLYD